VVARIWRTGVKPERFEEYERFARERSLPMFREQRGFIGVLFMREKADRAAVLTLWEDEKEVEDLEVSPLYRQTVEAILGSGLLAREQSVELFKVHGGRVLAADLAASQRDSGDRSSDLLRPVGTGFSKGAHQGRRTVPSLIK
jgi:heme-degrading monooxygenase HmoA